MQDIKSYKIFAKQITDKEFLSECALKCYNNKTA